MENKRRKGKPEHSSFISDIPMISLLLPPATLFGGSQG
jgi:hypothetical protein